MNAILKDSIVVSTILNDERNLLSNNTTLLVVVEQGTATDNRAAVVVTPNPASSIVNLYLSGFSGAAVIQVISLQGKLLKTFKAQAL